MNGGNSNAPHPSAVLEPPTRAPLRGSTVDPHGGENPPKTKEVK